MVATDSTIMPWGIHAGIKLGDVPFEYLLKYYRKQWIGGELLIWFEKQLRVIEESEAALGHVPGGKKPKKYLIENYECKYPYKK